MLDLLRVLESHHLTTEVGTENINLSRVCVLSQSVMSDSLLPYELKPTRLLCPWNSPGKNTGVGCHFLLWGIFPTQESNLCLLHLLHWEAGSFYHWDTQEAQSVSCYIELFWVIFNSDLCVHCCSVVIITTEIICTVWMFPSYAYSSPSLLDMSSKHRPQSVSSVQ